MVHNVVQCLIFCMMVLDDIRYDTGTRPFDYNGEFNNYIYNNFAFVLCYTTP